MEVRTMDSQIIGESRTTTDAGWGRLSAQLQGMECYMEEPDALAEWTTRQVLCHLLGEPGISLFKQSLGTDEVTIPTWAAALFGVHWGDHAGQLATIRKAVGLSEARKLAVAT
jgi:AAA+ superfamily predicted ATPase